MVPVEAKPIPLLTHLVCSGQIVSSFNPGVSLAGSHETPKHYKGFAAGWYFAPSWVDTHSSVSYVQLVSLFPPRVVRAVILPLVSSFVSSETTVRTTPTNSTVVPYLRCVSVGISRVEPSSAPVGQSACFLTAS